MDDPERAEERERGQRRRKWKKAGRCERLMKESEKLILTLLWAGRLRKIRERVMEGRDGEITRSTERSLNA